LKRQTKGFNIAQIKSIVNYVYRELRTR